MPAKKKASETNSLRNKAEEKLIAEKKRPLNKGSSQNGPSIINNNVLPHELQIHQIELEMQNAELRKAQIEIEKSRDNYADLYDFSPVGYFTFDKNGLIIETNLTGASLLQTDRSSMIRKPFSLFIHSIYKNAFSQHLKEVLRTGKRESCEIRLQLRPSEQTYVQRYIQLHSITKMSDTDGSSLIQTAMSDITGLKLVEEKLTRSINEWNDTFDIIPDPILITDTHYSIIKANKAAAQRIGTRQEDLIGRLCYKVIHGTEEPPSYCPHKESIAKAKTISKDIHEKYLKGDFTITSVPLFDAEGRMTGTIEVFHDITAQKQIERKLEEAAIKDDLTGLLNRRGFFDIAEKQCLIANRNNLNLYVLYIDLDGMKEINDRHGHEEGDMALVDTSHILNETFRSSDIIARIGGDEFVVMAMKTPDTDIEMLTGRLIIKMDHHNEKSKKPYRLSITTGLTLYRPENPCSVAELVAEADKVMYKQKKSKQKFRGHHT